ncbi:hypothetical protein FQR65_LT00257 [Abscondita terminalis]|nr:hypothetical protein FQR65_LT00257 [Abscondita terminalis]
MAADKTRLLSKHFCTAMSNYAAFRKVLDAAPSVAVLTGAGVSAESGIGTFRGTSGMWGTHKASDLASPQAFKSNPGLVWEFYEWRRSVAFKAVPNNAHLALAEYENKCIEEKRTFTLITQNVDGLHLRAGSRNVLEIHGSLRKVMCTKCKLITENTDIPICEALKDQRYHLEMLNRQKIPVSHLPKCKNCGGLLRPHIVWFGENLDETILLKCREALESCSLFLVIGTSGIVYPAAGFASFVRGRGMPIAEFNMESPVAEFDYVFVGPCGTTLPKALGLMKM